MQDEGNTIVGFLVGFFFGCLGLIIMLAVGGANSKKGAIMGFLVQVALFTCLGITSVGLNIALNS